MPKTDQIHAPVVAPPAPKLTAGDIRAALKLYFPHPEFGVVFEVAQATGFEANRHIDALVMDTWPSRGMRLKAVEIKVSRSDWRREKRDPAKAEQLARFCDEFWIAAPRGVVPPEELPAAWGLLETPPTPNRNKAALCVTRSAQKTKAEAPTREFLAAIFRAANRKVDGETLDGLLRDRRAELEADFDRRVKDQAERQTTRNGDGSKHWAALMADLGFTDRIAFEDWYNSDAQKVRRIFKALKATGIMEAHHGLAGLQALLSDMKNKVDKAMRDLSVESDR